MAGYSRQSTADIIANAVIKAAPVNAEYNALRDAFNKDSGHKHDGSTQEGAYVPLIADSDALNKVVIDTSNNRIGFFSEVSSSAVEQIRIQDGVIVPVTDNDIDLGTSSLEFKDLFIDGTATIDTLTVDESATITANLTVNGNTTLGDAATDTVTLTADVASAITPSADDTHDLGAVGAEWRNLYVDGQALIDDLVADTADINGGTIDGAVIGGNSAAAGTFVNITDTGTTTIATADINGGAIDGVTIGANSAGAGTFTEITASGAVALNGGLTMDTDKFTVADTTGNTSIGGTLGVTGVVTANAGVVIDNITIDGTEIDLSSGDLTVDVAGDIILDADGGDFKFQDGGTEILRITNSSSDVVIRPVVDAKDIIFQQRDGTEVARVEDNGTFNIVTDKLAINGTAVTSTAGELNILDGHTAASSVTIVDADRFVINDDGDMKQVAAAAISTYVGSSITSLSNLTTTGALDSGSITSGFGTIDTGSSTITTTGNITGGNLIISDGGNIGSASDTDAISIASGGNVTMTQDLTVTGNLTVNGSTSTISTTNTTIEDALIELGTGTTGTPSNDAGIVIERGSADNAFIGFDESADKFIVGTGSFTGASTGNLTISTGTLVANVEGTLQTAAQPNITSLGTLTALTVDDIAVDGKVITMTGSTDDTATLTVGTNGTLAITTTDTAAAAANITITADGTFEAVGTTITLDSGGGINLETDALSVGNGGDTDVVLTFNANSNDGVITWMEDEDYFEFSDDILINGTEKIQFGDTASFIHQSADGTLTIDGEAIIDLNASTRVDVSGDIKVGGEVQTAKIAFTDGDDAITIADGGGITANTSLTLASGSTVTSIKDEDNFTSNSDTALATQQSIKAYVDSTVGTANNVTGLTASGAELNAVADVSAITVDTSTAIVTADAIAILDASANSGSGAIGYFDVDLLDTYFSGTEKTLTQKTLTNPKVTGLKLDDAGLTIEGSSANDHETVLNVTDPTADRTITLPDATGTVALLSSAQDFTAQQTFSAGIDLDNNEFIGWGGGSSRPAIVGNKSTDTFALYTAGNERLRVDSSGNFIVGKTTSTIGTAGTSIESTGRVEINADSTTPLNISRITDEGDMIEFYEGSTSRGKIGIELNDLFITSTNTGFRFDYNTNRVVPCTTTGAGSDNTDDFGDPSVRWKDGYFAGTITAGAFSGDGSALTGTGGASDFQEFTSSGTYTKPSGVNYIFVEAIGGGGSGAKGNFDGDGAQGGGGGAYVSQIFRASDVGSTETVTIGAGGASTTSSGSGNDGGTTSFGSLVTALGGEGGLKNAGTGRGNPYDPSNTSNVDVVSYAGRGGLANGHGGKTIYGGGGGAGAKTLNRDGGASVFGGDGGASFSDGTNGVAGTAPGGGGGAADTGNGGAGAAGRIRVSAW